MTPTQQEIIDLVTVITQEAGKTAWNPEWTERMGRLNPDAQLVVWTRLVRSNVNDIKVAKAVHLHLHRIVLDNFASRSDDAPTWGMNKLDDLIVELLSGAGTPRWDTHLETAFNDLSTEEKDEFWSRLVTSGECDIELAEKIQKHIEYK